MTMTMESTVKMGGSNDIAKSEPNYPTFKFGFSRWTDFEKRDVALVVKLDSARSMRFSAKPSFEDWTLDNHGCVGEIGIKEIYQIHAKIKNSFRVALSNEKERRADEKDWKRRQDRTAIQKAQLEEISRTNSAACAIQCKLGTEYKVVADTADYWSSIIISDVVGNYPVTVSYGYTDKWELYSNYLHTRCHIKKSKNICNLARDIIYVIKQTKAVAERKSNLKTYNEKLSSAMTKLGYEKDNILKSSSSSAEEYCEKRLGWIKIETDKKNDQKFERLYVKLGEDGEVLIISSTMIYNTPTNINQRQGCNKKSKENEDDHVRSEDSRPDERLEPAGGARYNIKQK